MAISKLNPSPEEKLAHKLEANLVQKTKQESQVYARGGEGTKQETNEVTFVRTNEGLSTPRRKTRHTFDVFSDQVLSLKEIQIVREKREHKKYRLGDLVQEAIDLLITKERNKKHKKQTK